MSMPAEGGRSNWGIEENERKIPTRKIGVWGTHGTRSMTAIEEKKGRADLKVGQYTGSEKRWKGCMETNCG